MPLTIIATDLDTGELISIKTGKLSEAVRASISLPGVFDPRTIDGRHLVDGGLTNNLPIESLPSGPVIAVSAIRDIRRKLRYERRVLGTVFQKTLFGNIYNIAQKTFDIILSQNESRSVLSRPEITYIRPNFEANLDYLDFRKYKKFIAAGYEKATEILG
jgi:NTE family protein